MAQNTPPPLTMTDAAAAQICTVIANKADAKALRIKVAGGGCSGFQYLFSIDKDAPSEKDHTLSHNGATLYIDTASIPLIKDSEIDYVEDVLGSSFRVNNPNATAACGCGTSFSVF